RGGSEAVVAVFDDRDILGAAIRAHRDLDGHAPFVDLLGVGFGRPVRTAPLFRSSERDPARAVDGRLGLLIAPRAATTGATDFLVLLARTVFAGLAAGIRGRGAGDKTVAREVDHVVVKNVRGLRGIRRGVVVHGLDLVVRILFDGLREHFFRLLFVFGLVDR